MLEKNYWGHTKTTNHRRNHLNVPTTQYETTNLQKNPELTYKKKKKNGICQETHQELMYRISTLNNQGILLISPKITYLIKTRLPPSIS